MIILGENLVYVIYAIIKIIKYLDIIHNKIYITKDYKNDFKTCKRL